MKGTLKRLPPFAPDYSGVSAVFHELGGLVIINGADGCIGNVTGYDEPRFFENTGLIVSSGLREINAITGDEELLLKKIEDLNLNRQIPFVVLLGTPTSAVIASDHQGVGKLFYKESNIPVLAIPTTGIDSYEIGIEKALLALAETFVRPLDGPKEGVNIIGCTPLDYWGRNQVTYLQEALESEGISLNTCWTMSGGLKAIQSTLRGKMNLVVSAGAIKVADYLKEVYGMPYIVDVPIGKEGAELIAKKINVLLSNVDGICSSSVYKNMKEDGLIDTLIIGDQVWANAYRQYLIRTGVSLSVSVASFFKMRDDLMQKGDFRLHSEQNFKDCLAFKKPKRIIGDPLYKRLLKKNSGVEFIGVPHLAVSSRLYWHHDIRYVGKEITIGRDEIRK